MRINERLILLVTLLAIPLYLLLVWLVSQTVLGDISLRKMNEKGFLSAVSYDGRNATYHYLLGRFYHYQSENPDLNKAISYYRESVRLCPLQGGCWLDLSKAYQITGRIKDAENAMERALRLNPKNPAVMWEAGVFYLINGNVDIAVTTLREFVLLKPEKQEEVYDLFWKLQLDPQYVLTSIVPYTYPYYKRYFLYLLSAERTEEMHTLWSKMTGFPAEDELFVRYTDYLVAHSHYEEAEHVWKDFVEKKFTGKTEDQSSLIYNGSFEFEILNGGFDWKIGKTEGAKVFLDSDTHIRGGRSLGVAFDGKHNPVITIASQVVRVAPGANYLLRGYIKTDKLTTTNGVFFSVEGHNCKGMYKKSEVLTGNNFWREVTIEFTTPPDCSALSVNLRREKSDKLDNKIGGTAWVDGISLNQK